MSSKTPDVDGGLAWLSSCQGFRLEARGRRIGIVEDVLYGDDPEPAALLVRGGLFGAKTIIVPVDEVIEVEPRSKRVVVRDGEAGEPSA
ncbi:MAG TPA: PRC-barrel domain-containing protein [Gaiellaceae bacterium]|nr:PRC-barrel domain-containing protein [Gaiellaceae bacterium]